MKKNRYATKRFEKLIKSVSPHKKEHLLDQFSNELNRFYKSQRYTDVLYRCNCSWCLRGKNAKTRRKIISLNEQVKEFATAQQIHNAEITALPDNYYIW